MTESIRYYALVVTSHNSIAYGKTVGTSESIAEAYRIMKALKLMGLETTAELRKVSL